MDVVTLLLLGFLTWACAGMFVKNANRRSLKIKYALFGTMYYLYSGVGIAYVEDGSRYVLPYFFFLLAVNSGIAVAAGRKGSQADVPASGTAPQGRAWWGDSVSTVLAATYVLAALGQVIVVGATGDLLRPDRVLVEIDTGREIFTNRLARSENPYFVALGYVKLLATPFFFIELQRRLNRRWLAQLAALLVITYFEFAADGHWGRTALLEPFGLWLIILYMRNQISGRRLAGLAIVGFALILPILNWLVTWRTRGSGGMTADGFFANLEVFRTQELGYPSLYPVAEAIGESGGYASQYLAWIFTLPLPRGLTNTSFSVTRDFSEQVLGIAYGQPGFYILLPSWLGEAFIAFGPDYYFAWGAIVGLVIGFVDRFLSSTPRLDTFNAYVTVLLAIYARSVSQEFIAQMVSCLWILIALFCVAAMRERIVGGGRGPGLSNSLEGRQCPGETKARYSSLPTTSPPRTKLHPLD